MRGQSSVIGLRQQFSTLWLAATNPRRLSKDDILEEQLEERCQQIVKYLSPFFTLDLNQSDEEPSESNISRCRVTLYVAVQLLFGLHVVFDKKVALVQKQLSNLLQEVKIHLNLAINLKQNAKKVQNKRASVKNQDFCQNITSKKVSQMMQEIETNDISEYIDKVLANQTKAGLGDDDSILETLKSHPEVEDLINFGDPDFKVDSINDILKMSDNEIDFEKKFINQAELDGALNDLDATPAPYNFVPSPANKRSPDMSNVNLEGLKRKKLVYESFIAEKVEKKLKKRTIQIDTAIDLTSSHIKSSLANTRDIVKKQLNHEYVLYHRQKLFYISNNSELEQYLTISDNYFASKYTESLAKNFEHEVQEEQNIADNIFQLRDSNTYNDERNIKQSKNLSESSLRLRNNSQDELSSVGLIRSRIENSPQFNPPDLDDLYNHSNDLFQSNLRDNFDENLKIDENFTKHKGMAFDEIYQPGVASKRKTAEGFYRILRNASDKQIEIEQRTIMGRIIIKTL